MSVNFRSTSIQVSQARVVRDLTREIVGNFHQVYLHNFFASVDLMISLIADKILVLRTLMDKIKG